MTSSSQQSQEPDTISYISQADAAAIDELFMGPLGFSVDQLMELAGLSVAAAIAEVYGVANYPRVLVICGPGNNGGDGLVAARHLYHFGYKPSIISEAHGQASVSWARNAGKPRPPFDTLLQRLSTPNDSGAENAGVPFVVSIDIPSGWHVEEGDIEGSGFMPHMLVSLTAPKKCATFFKGAHHFLGGRFIPPAVVYRYGLKLPAYPGTSVCVRIGKQTSIEVAALRGNYVGYVLSEDQALPDPTKQIQAWFEDAVSAGVYEPNVTTLARADADGNPCGYKALSRRFLERSLKSISTVDPELGPNVSNQAETWLLDALDEELLECMEDSEEDA